MYVQPIRAYKSLFYNIHPSYNYAINMVVCFFQLWIMLNFGGSLRCNYCRVETIDNFIDLVQVCYVHIGYLELYVMYAA